MIWMTCKPPDVYQAQVGRVLPVLVEGYGDGISVARSYREAPEIDGYVLIPGELPVGELVPVRVDGAMVYDLTAVPDLAEPPAGLSFDARPAISLSSITLTEAS